MSTLALCIVLWLCLSYVIKIMAWLRLASDYIDTHTIPRPLSSVIIILVVLMWPVLEIMFLCKPLR